MENDGAWKAAFEKNLGPAGINAPTPPPSTSRPRATAEPVEIFTEYQDQIFEAFWTTIQLTVYSAVGALILGTVLAAMRLAPVPMLNWLGTTYVNVVRNTPLTLIILFCSFGLSQTLGITLVDSQSMTSIEDSNFRLAVLGLTVYTAAFVCETVRVRGEHRAAGPGRGGPVAGPDVRTESPTRVAAAGLSRGHHPTGFGPDRVDEEHHDRLGDRRGRAALLMKEMIENTARCYHRRDLRARVRHPDASAGAAVRLAGQAIGGGHGDERLREEQTR